MFWYQQNPENNLIGHPVCTIILLLLSANDAGPAGAVPSDLVAQVSGLGPADVAAAGRAAERVARLQAEEAVVALLAFAPRFVRRVSTAISSANVLFTFEFVQHK